METGHLTVMELGEILYSRVMEKMALYSGYGANNKALKLGIADVKPRGWGWYAHGRFSLPTPALAKSDALSCAIALLPSSGERFLIVSVESIEVTFDTGLRKEAVMRDDTFAAITSEATAIVRVLAIDKNGQVVRELEPSACVMSDAWG